MTGNDWLERAKEIAKLDGDEWDAANEKFEEAWKEAYMAAFIKFAMTRNWHEEDARDYAHELANEAFIEAYTQDYKIEEIARFDVLSVEETSD